MWTIQADCPISRRKVLCYVLDGNDTLLCTTSSLAKALDWCRENGEDQVLLETPEVKLEVKFQPPGV